MKPPAIIRRTLTEWADELANDPAVPVVALQALTDDRLDDLTVRIDAELRAWARGER